jgi:hypothetical protein
MALQGQAPEYVSQVARTYLGRSTGGAGLFGQLHLVCHDFSWAPAAPAGAMLSCRHRASLGVWANTSPAVARRTPRLSAAGRAGRAYRMNPACHDASAGRRVYKIVREAPGA